MSLKWIIIGGGIHGVHVAVRLLGEVGVPRESLRIVDPSERLLDRWKSCTERTGMTHLRSPAVHHLDLHPCSLRRFAGKRRKRRSGLFAFPYDRPALSLFNDHCDEILERYRLDELHVRGLVTKCDVDCESVRVRLEGDSELQAENVALAIGASESPRWPKWAPRSEPRVQHIFASDFDGWPVAPETVAVVGGGISAGQVALRLLREGHQVHLVLRHAFRKHQFDSDPGWLGPKHMRGFGRVRDRNARRVMISEARHKGSLPPDVVRDLERAIDDGELRSHRETVSEVQSSSDQLTLVFGSEDSIAVDRIILATGFASKRPGGEMVDHLVADAALPCAACGYPVVDRGLRWHPRVVVSGPLAELELGPAARNIAGARRAGDRIVDGLRDSARAS